MRQLFRERQRILSHPTTVNLGVTPLIFISGHVVVEGTGGKVASVSGVRVILRDAATDKFVADSITAEDGSYYLGNILPGKYTLAVDDKTLPPGIGLDNRVRAIELKAKKDFQQITLDPFKAEIIKPQPPATQPARTAAATQPAPSTQAATSPAGLAFP